MIATVDKVKPEANRVVVTDVSGQELNLPRDTASLALRHGDNINIKRLSPGSLNVDSWEKVLQGGGDVANDEP